ncbi:MAG: DNA repair protein RadA [Phycisphaeraceae bacterium]|nr:MAG: DNA repair protein RadA [Phycisphaeraceae bacterium]
MAKRKTLYLCTTCGSTQARWAGKCPDCGTWDSLVEQKPDTAADPQKGLIEHWTDAVDGEPASDLRGAPKAAPIDEVAPEPAASARLATGIGEFDRVLGGNVEGPDRGLGLVPGSTVLIGGEPGIGKSTLLLQAAAGWASVVDPKRGPDWSRRVLYVTSEESAEQVQRRAARLSIAGEPNLYVLADTNLARIVEQVRKVKPAVLVIDSVQMIYKADLDASPGSVTQLRRCAAELVYLAKASGTAVLLVGHVTKEGQLAGPRVLEHLVDAVLYFEGDRFHAGRIVRAVKNRYGTTLELGLFEMGGSGLVPVTDGGGASFDDSETGPGSVVCPVIHGSRCVLVEIQALTATGFLGAAKRKSSGLDTSRLAMLIAVLEQHAGLRLADRDIFASAVGGVRVVEPASDLALLLAIAGAHYRRAIEPRTVAVGEVGLGGEVRPVSQIEQRLREAARLGARRAVIPAMRGRMKIGGLEVVEVRGVGRGIELLC